MSQRNTSAKKEQPRTLIPLTEYERVTFLKWNPERIAETPNGIECPNCHGRELLDGTAVLRNNPPRLQIHCTGCDFQGYRTLSPSEV